MTALPASLLAQAINRVLAHQPAARAHLQPHAGKHLVLNLPLGTLELALDAAGTFYQPGAEAEADALAGSLATLTLTPDLSALPRWLSGGRLSELFQIEGDTAFAADLGQAMAEFDWVLALRPYLGDIAASRVEQALQGLGAWGAQAGAALGRNLTEYAIHEAEVLAEPHAVRAFIAEVDRLREHADRLSARLTLLESRPPR